MRADRPRSGGAPAPPGVAGPVGAEWRRLADADAHRVHWRRWGPFLSARQWGTVREDYSADGTAWTAFPHDHARSRAYRWGEDGIAGLSDRHGLICFALTLWNRADPILKERLFGLTGLEGNHGEDVKEYYFHLDNTPCHTYMRYLYKYPQAVFPYDRLVAENARRGRQAPEYELLDTGVFDGDRYFDVLVEYAKAGPEDVLVRITATNRGPAPAPLDLLPTLWFRNTWSWGIDIRRPRLRLAEPVPGGLGVEVVHPMYGVRWFLAAGAPRLLFTENETNFARLWGGENATPHVKDGIDDYVVHGRADAVSLTGPGTKLACHYPLALAAGASLTVRLRLAAERPAAPFDGDFEATFALRQQEAEEFYATVIPARLSADARRVARQAFAGLLWSKQHYHYEVARWLRGDPAGPPPPPERRRGRNHKWTHLYNDDVLSMPDTWEYPWYAAWDLAFHTIPLALVDPEFAKEQLLLLLREWYMHPSGQLPAYEWAFDDVNPPVHAWAVWRVYKIDRRVRGQADRGFLERAFHKLLLNFTWWVNRKDAEERNVFQGGFLGLDNIGVFDRSAPLPGGGFLEQADGTAWMAGYCLQMLAMALELAREDSAYEDVASKFFEHWAAIAHAMNDLAGEGIELWNEADGFYYDALHPSDGRTRPLRIRSLVGLIPLVAVLPLEPEHVDRFPGFKRRFQWFIENRPELANHVETQSGDRGVRRLLTLANRTRLRRILRYMLDEAEFLSPYGIRALSRYHRDHPFVLAVNGAEYRVGYEPAESTTGLFGGNSNWRGPVWFPVNVLLIEALQRFHHFWGPSLTVEFPTGTGRRLHLGQVATELSRRLVRVFLRGADGRRPVYGGTEKFQTDPHWRDHILFYEYFHGDNGAGIGASHQTGWTALVAKLLQQSGE
jgi:hypothetical protein